MIAAGRMLNAGATGSLTVGNVPAGPAKATVLPMLARARSALALACRAAGRRAGSQALRVGSPRHTGGMVSVIGEDDSDAFDTNVCDTLS
jgi:hypothetical protein